MDENELLELIAQAVREGWTDLFLDRKGITKLPPEIGQLQNLQLLHLRRNELTAVPPEIGQLQNLQSLDLNFNKLKAVPPEIGQLQNLQSLYLDGNQLTAVPPEIGQLQNLQSLYLRRNELTAVPPEINQLQNLQSLDLGGNKLAAVPPEIGQLQNLQTLSLVDNQLTAVPPEMGQLQSLQWLSLSHNQLTTVPPEMGQLQSLQWLNLSFNKLTSVPLEMGQLQNLQLLHLQRNELTAVPPEIFHLQNLQALDFAQNKIDSLPQWLLHLPELKKLLVEDNPLTNLPPEILGNAIIWESVSNRRPVNLSALRRYYTQLQEAGETTFYEAKLLIIGEGGAGKTSLARKLQDPTARMPQEEESTTGIAVMAWHFPISPNSEEQYQANLWDFGGQEIYFATHQFFLTRRSVYILVTDTRQQHTDFYTWLFMQETFGDNSPIILLKNQNRQKGNKFTIENLPQLRERFPNLKEVLELDLNEAPTTAQWPQLLAELKYRLMMLEHIGQMRPRTWVAVRHALQNDPRDTLTKAEYLALCEEHGIQNEQYALDLSDYLHHVGDILHFQKDFDLLDLVILKPTWGLDAVYRVLDNKEIEKKLGQFTLADLRKLWHEPKYEGHHRHLLRLMENFQLCYPLPNHPHTYIAPQLLGDEVPPYSWNQTDNLQLRYRYPVFMPRGILSRAIVKLHQRIEEQTLVWAAGVILKDEYARAELLEWRGAKEIRIRVAGRNKRDLLMEIVRALDELHRGFPKLSYEKLVPCHCPTCLSDPTPHFFDLEKLRQRHAHNKRTIECERPPFAEVSVPALLDSGAMPTEERYDLGQLLGLLDKHYNDGELRTLCLQLGVDYDNLGGNSKIDKARELIQKLKRHGRLDELQTISLHPN